MNFLIGLDANLACRCPEIFYRKKYIKLVRLLDDSVAATNRRSLNSIIVYLKGRVTVDEDRYKLCLCGQTI